MIINHCVAKRGDSRGKSVPRKRNMVPIKTINDRQRGASSTTIGNFEINSLGIGMYGAGSCVCIFRVTTLHTG